MSFNQISFGEPKRNESPSINVRPPTEAREATLPGIIVTDQYDDSLATPPFDWTIPSNMLAGDLAISVISLSDSGVLTIPTGWTQFGFHFDGGTIRTYFLYRIIDGSESSPISISTTSTPDVMTFTWYLRSNGADFSLAPPEVTATNAQGSGIQVNPPSHSPTTGAGRYFIFAGAAMAGWGFGGTNAPSGYTNFEANTVPGKYHGDVNWALIDVTTAEDPGAYGVASASAGDGYTGWTISVLQKPSGDGDVATGDHTHTEDEVTDHTTLTQKATPVAADLVKIYDSEDSNTAKYSELGDLPGGGAGATAIDDLTDVTITTPADNEVVAYDSGTAGFINQTAAEAGLSATGHTHTESDITDLPGHSHTESDISDLDHWTETDHDALDHSGLTGVGTVTLHGASPQSDGSLRFEYGLDSSGRPTYTAAGTTDSKAIVVLVDGRTVAREVTI